MYVPILISSHVIMFSLLSTPSSGHTVSTEMWWLHCGIFVLCYFGYLTIHNKERRQLKKYNMLLFEHAWRSTVRYTQLIPVQFLRLQRHFKCLMLLKSFIRVLEIILLCFLFPVLWPHLFAFSNKFFIISFSFINFWLLFDISQDWFQRNYVSSHVPKGYSLYSWVLLLDRWI